MLKSTCKRSQRNKLVYFTSIDPHTNAKIRNRHRINTIKRQKRSKRKNHPDISRTKAQLRRSIPFNSSTNRANVEQTINSVKPDFIIHYDHGSTYTLYGQNNNAITPAIDSANVDLLTARAVSTVSCESAEGLGPLAVNSADAKAYIGYDELHWVHLWYLDKFTEASNAANYALLEGKTFQQAYDIAIQKYTEKYNELTTLDVTAAGLMLHDRDHLTLLGNTSAKASGLIISAIKTATILPKLKATTLKPEVRKTT